MSLRFDVVFKAIVGNHIHDYAAAFGFTAAEPATVLNVDLSTLSAATDVALGFGNPISSIVDLNFQTGPDKTLAARLHLYNAALHLRYGVPVQSVLVLMRAKADARNLTGRLEYQGAGGMVQFPYRVVRVWQQPADTYLQGGLGLLPLATLSKMPEGKPLLDGLREIVQQIDGRLAKAANQADATTLMTAANVLAGMRVKKANLVKIFEGVRTMSKTAWDDAIDQGQVIQAQKTLLRLGRQRFKSADAQTKAAVAAIDDLRRLDRMLIALLTASSWDDLLATQ